MSFTYRTEPMFYRRFTNGGIYYGDSINYLKSLNTGTIDLVVTSPPFGLIRQKEYGNVSSNEYLSWFSSYAEECFRVLKDSGSLVIDIGGTWNQGVPTRSLYHFKLLIMMCEEFGFHLAQEFYWWNPSRLPSPAEWVNVRRIRVKDAVNTVWWLSKTEWPKASNRRVLQRYSESMLDLLENGYRAKQRPSGHNISDKFSSDHGGAIPPNLLAIATSESNSPYIQYCNDKGIKVHPARFPSQLPEFFVRMLTDKGDLVVDPFAGSCVTGEVCERLGREWTCCEYDIEYIQGALGRFAATKGRPHARDSDPEYRIKKPFFSDSDETTLSPDGGRRKQIVAKQEL